MNKETFKSVIDKGNVDVSNINALLGISKDFYIDYGHPTAHVDYELEPDPKSWGLRSISINVTKVYCDIEWEIDSSEMSEEEKALFVKAGGTEYRNDTIGGSIEVDSTKRFQSTSASGFLSEGNWEISTQDLEFESDGGFDISGVEIDFSNYTILLS